MRQRRGDPKARRGGRRGAAAVVAVALLAAGTLVGATPAAAAGGITVTPDSGLVDHQTVQVHGSGWQPGVTVAACQAILVGEPGQGDCVDGAYQLLSPDGAGEFTTTFVVKRHATTFEHPQTVDCADPADPCVIGAADSLGIGTTFVQVPLDFAPVPRVAVPGSASVVEGDSGTTSVAVPLTLSFASDLTTTVDWGTVFVPGAPAGQADPANDYTPTGGTLTFAPGETTTTAVIEILGDEEIEPDEYIVAQFGNPTNAVMGGFWGLGFGNITNDDIPPRVVPGSGTTSEGDADSHDVTIPVTLSAASPLTVTVDWTTVPVPGAPDFQAEPASDYTAATGTVIFAPGETEQPVVISVNGDTTVEPDEYFVLVMGNPTNAVMGGFWGLGFGQITNDDT